MTRQEDLHHKKKSYRSNVRRYIPSDVLCAEFNVALVASGNARWKKTKREMLVIEPSDCVCTLHGVCRFFIIFDIEHENRDSDAYSIWPLACGAWTLWPFVPINNNKANKFQHFCFTFRCNFSRIHFVWMCSSVASGNRSIATASMENKKRSSSNNESNVQRAHVSRASMGTTSKQDNKMPLPRLMPNCERIFLSIFCALAFA